jgi:hypothetical protein
MEKSKLRKIKKARQRRAKSRACSSFSLISRGIITKNLSWQANQSILHTTVTFYGDCAKIFEDFALNFGGKRTDCCIMTMQSHISSYTTEFVTKSNMTVILKPSQLPDLAPCDFSLFPQLKIPPS